MCFYLIKHTESRIPQNLILFETMQISRNMRKTYQINKKTIVVSTHLLTYFFYLHIDVSPTTLYPNGRNPYFKRLQHGLHLSIILYQANIFVLDTLHYSCCKFIITS